MSVSGIITVVFIPAAGLSISVYLYQPAMLHGLSLEVSCSRPLLISKNSIGWMNFIYNYMHIPFFCNL